MAIFKNQKNEKQNWQITPPPPPSSPFDEIHLMLRVEPLCRNSRTWPAGGAASACASACAASPPIPTKPCARTSASPSCAHAATPVQRRSKKSPHAAHTRRSGASISTFFAIRARLVPLAAFAEGLVVVVVASPVDAVVSTNKKQNFLFRQISNKHINTFICHLLQRRFSQFVFELAAVSTMLHDQALDHTSSLKPF